MVVEVRGRWATRVEMGIKEGRSRRESMEGLEKDPRINQRKEAIARNSMLQGMEADQARM